MEDLAKDNMPFMGLEIHGLEEYTLPSDLPHTSGMRQRGFKFEKLEDLLAARLSGASKQQQQQSQAASTSLTGGRTETPLSTQEGGTTTTYFCHIA